jgi:hypothetical protein
MSEELSATRTASCAICRKPVELEAAKTDEQGRAVHEDCYWANLQRDALATPTEAAERLEP